MNKVFYDGQPLDECVEEVKQMLELISENVDYLTDEEGNILDTTIINRVRFDSLQFVIEKAINVIDKLAKYCNF